MNRDATDLAGVRHLTFESLGSTNAEALARSRAGERGPLWISAGTQTGGRGRRGKSWVSPLGNLHATLLLSEPSRPAVAPQLSFVTALAVHDAISACAPRQSAGLKLKWPNDLLLYGRKLAGLLIEAESQPRFAVAVGIGVNCASHPVEAAYPATALGAHDAAVEPLRVLEVLSAAMHKRLDQWESGANFSAIRSDWVSRAAGLGEPIRVRLPEREFEGVFQGLDENGELLVQTNNDAIEKIAAGEIFALGAG